jgi:photosystem II stability/assembly factor-like uncharacterized protein
MFRISSILFGLLLSFAMCSCQFAANGKKANANQEVNPTSSLLKIDDADWDFNLIGKVPENCVPCNISCTKDGSCWFWSSHSIGMVDSSGTWQKIVDLDSNEPDPLIRVQLFSSRIAWIVRNSGLYKTDDAGTHWQRIAVPALDNREGAIWGVYFRNDQIGWVVGGKYEARPTIPEVNNALSDDRERVLVGCILKTTDGGKTWQTQEINGRIGRFTEILFWNDNIGMAFGDAGYMLTANGGTHWADIGKSLKIDKTGDRRSVLSAFFINQDHGWVLLGGSELMVTSDAGKSWRSVADSRGAQPDNLAEVTFLTVNDGLAISDRLTGGKLFKTIDGGKTWNQILTEEKFYFMTSRQSERIILSGDRSIYEVQRRIKSIPGDQALAH